MPTKSTTKKPTTRKPATKAKPAVRKVSATAHAPAAHAAPRQKTTSRTYIFAVGRRKEAVARVRWHKKAQGDFTVNQRTLNSYFPTQELQKIVTDPLKLTEMEAAGHFTVRVAGGGLQGQAEAVRLGIARALVKDDADLRLPLKRAGFLRRDPRVKERKKYGLKRARRAPQWQKR